MDSDDRHTEPGGGEVKLEDNVVRLPREWLGPPEELVPLGIQPERADDLRTPPSTHDFWGEPTVDFAHGRHVGVNRSVGPSARWSARRLSGRRFTSTSHRPRPAAVGVIVGAAILVGIGLALGASPRPHEGSRLRAAVPSTVSRSEAPKPSALSAAPGLGSGRVRRATHRSPGQRRASRAVRHVNRARTTGRARHATVERFRHDAPPAKAAASSSTGGATPPSTSAPVASSGPVNISAPPASSAATASPTAAPAVNQPALGANGALGPGSSPDG